MKTATFEIEKNLLQSQNMNVIGIDEAGRGPLAGPVVAAAVCVKDPASLEVHPEEGLWRFVRDSKTLSEKKREELFDHVQAYFHVGVGLCDRETIDRMNILQATFLAMKKAVGELEKKLEGDTSATHQVLLDGSLAIPNFSHDQKPIPKGDSRSKTIAAASIIAKVSRDRIVLEFAKQYPEYGFDQHKGYGTAFHMEQLKHLGPCPEHRMSFGPVKRCLPQEIEKMNRRLAT